MTEHVENLKKFRAQLVAERRSHVQKLAAGENGDEHMTGLLGVAKGIAAVDAAIWDEEHPGSAG
jgi:hypothetical protein